MCARARARVCARVRACVRVCVRACMRVRACVRECVRDVFAIHPVYDNNITGMDITCVYTSFYGFICDSARLLHVKSDVIRTIVVRRRPNRMMTYVIT